MIQVHGADVDVRIFQNGGYLFEVTDFIFQKY
jgi:hypothetical protein